MESKTKTTAQEEILTITQTLKKEWIKPEMESLEVNNGPNGLSDEQAPGFS